MNNYLHVTNQLRENPQSWLITGAAGFIGSHLVETLLELDQKVIGLDNLSTGHRHNLDDIARKLPEKFAANFTFVEGDIKDAEVCQAVTKDINVVLHQAALGSVPRSIENPLVSHQNNVDGFLNMLIAAKENGVKRFVFASSSSVYGDHERLPKVEDIIGKPLSPYAATKYFNEVYADVFARNYDLETIGLRYFNIFGPRQDPNGPYAAVIPRWIASLRQNNPSQVFGDGETSRDFCFIRNAVQANILAGCVTNQDSVRQIYNVACGQRTTLNELYRLLREEIALTVPAAAKMEPQYRGFRPGDVRHSLADITKAEKLLGYQPTYYIREGLKETVAWFLNVK